MFECHSPLPLSHRGCEELLVLKGTRPGMRFFLRGFWGARSLESAGKGSRKQIALQCSQTLIPLCFHGLNPGRDGRERLWSWHIPPLPTHLVDRHETSLL